MTDDIDYTRPTATYPKHAMSPYSVAEYFLLCAYNEVEQNGDPEASRTFSALGAGWAALAACPQARHSTYWFDKYGELVYEDPRDGR